MPTFCFRRKNNKYNDNVEKRINEIIDKYKNKESVATTPPVNTG